MRNSGMSPRTGGTGSTVALKVLAPVLSERTAQGEVRVYHESFARYLRLARSRREKPSLAIRRQRLEGPIRHGRP